MADEQPIEPEAPLVGETPAQDSAPHVNGAAPPDQTSPEKVQEAFNQLAQAAAEAIAGTYPRTFLGDQRKPEQQQINFIERRFNDALAVDRNTYVNAMLLGAQLTALSNIVEHMFNLMFQGIPDGPQKPDFGLSYKMARVKEFTQLRDQMLAVTTQSKILVPQGRA